ncbi:MAG: hypothetical protein AMJ90_08220, partial [candidate division Zixibacteria bacterium SM23_73_2]
QNLGVFADYKLFSQVKLFQSLGFKGFQRKFGGERKPDEGYDHLFRLSYTPELFGSELSLNFDQQTEEFKDIPKITRKAALEYQRVFNPTDSLRMFFESGWSKKKYYQSFTSDRVNTQRKSESILSIFSSKKIFWGFQMGVGYDYSKNQYRYTTEEDEGFDPFIIGDNVIKSHDLSLDLGKEFLKRFHWQAKYEYRKSSEDYGDIDKNQKMESGEIKAEIKMKLFSSDSLYLSGSVGVTSFFTPQGSANFSDRDILTKFGHSEYLHVFSPSFDLRIKLGFKNFHQIYISEELSANNNYNETYILSPILTFKPNRKTRISQIYSIQANYITYDYETETYSPRNKILRRASSVSRINYSFSQRTDLELGYVYRYEDYGQLFWRNQWTQRRSWERKTHRVNADLRYSFTDYLVFSPGYTYERKNEWDLTQIKEELNYWFYRNMFTISADLFLKRQNRLSLSWTHRFQEARNSEKEEANFLSLSLSYRF